MAALSRKLRSMQSSRGQGVGFWCPGCKEMHRVDVGAGAWSWDGNVDTPTFSPSVLVTSGHYVAGQEGKRCWCNYNAEHPDKPAPFTCGRCHSFVQAGQIQFLGDCTHALAGQTVPLPDLPGASE